MCPRRQPRQELRQSSAGVDPRAPDSPKASARSEANGEQSAVRRPPGGNLPSQPHDMNGWTFAPVVTPQWCPRTGLPMRVASDLVPAADRYSIRACPSRGWSGPQKGARLRPSPRSHRMCPWAQSQARTKSSAYSAASGRNGRRQSRPPTARSLAVVPAGSTTSGGHQPSTANAPKQGQDRACSGSSRCFCSHSRTFHVERLAIGGIGCAEPGDLTAGTLQPFYNRRNSRQR